MSSWTLRERTPPAARVLPAHVFYGWFIAAGAAFVMMGGIGIGFYGLAVFLEPLQEKHGWSNAQVSGATGLYFVVSGLAAALAGPLIDRRGPIPFIVAGLVLTATTLASIGFVEALWQLYIAYTILAVGFGIGGSVCINAIMARWFIRLRARAMSISATGISLAGVVLPPLGAVLIDAGGLELTTPVLGAVVAAFGLPIVFLVLVPDPAQMGLHPDGDERPPPGLGAALSEAVQRRVWTIGEVLRTVAFWALAVAFVLVLLAQTGFLIHQIAFLEERMGSRTAASLALSTAAFGSIVARLIVGLFADAIDKRHLAAGIFAIQGAAVLLITLVDQTATTYVLTLVFGFTIGNVYMMQSLLVSEIFGLVSFATVFGLVSFSSQTSSGAGPLLVGVLEEASGGYETPFLITAAITFAAAVVVTFARPPAPPNARV